MLNPEDAYQRLLQCKDELIEMNRKSLNEADTRLKIIDTLFIEVLGWNKQDLEAEHSIGETRQDQEHRSLFADYLLQSDNNYFLIEAKRNERYFHLPSSLIRTYKQTGVLTSDKDNKMFIDQAVQYMNKIGTPFCVLCNGLQMIIIRRKGVLQKRDVLVFKGIEDILSNFIDFYSILNPYEAGDIHLDKILERSNELRQPPIFSKKVISSFTDKHEQTSSSEIRAVTEDYVAKYFSELTSTSKIETLKECYVDPQGKFNQFSQQLKQRIVSKQIKELKNIKVGDEHKLWGRGNFEKEYITNLQENDSAVFVLAGGVGAGKSTFINHFYFYELEDSVRKNLIWINLDFLDFTERSDEVDSFIFKVIFQLVRSESFRKFDINKWETKLKIYKKDLDIHLEGLPPFILNDPLEVEKEKFKVIEEWERDQHSHLINVFRYLREELDQKICFVFDNTDQKTDEEQLQVLMSAFKWAKEFQATIITSLRLENYFSAKDKPPFDAYQPITFRIEPPSVKELLKKRLHVSKQYSKEHFIIDVSNGVTTKVLKISIAKFVKILENTLDQVPETEVEEMFENLSGGNMRRILQIFKKFIQSGNFKLYQNYDLIKRIDNACFDYEEILESIALGDNKYYQSFDSPIQNIFSFSHADGFNSHFTILYLLKYLETKSQTHTQYNDGFVLIEDLYNRFEFLFGSIDSMKRIIEYLLTQFIIESDIGERKALVNTKSIAISELGLYYLNHFLKDWNYFKYIMIDTSIKSNAAHTELTAEVKKAFRSKNKNAKLKNNLKSIEIFLKYLEKSEREDIKYIQNVFPKQYSTHLKPCMPQIIQDFNHSRANQLTQTTPKRC